MKSKIHPYAVIFTVVTVLLSIPAFMMAAGVIDDYLRSPANIFIVIMLFFGLLAITFFIFGWRNLKQLNISEKYIELKWLGRWNMKRLDFSENTKYTTRDYNYLIFKITRTIIEDWEGRQIQFNNLDFRNTKSINEYLKKQINQQSVQSKIDLFDKVFIILFILASLYMIITGILNITF